MADSTSQPTSTSHIRADSTSSHTDPDDNEPFHTPTETTPTATPSTTTNNPQSQPGFLTPSATLTPGHTYILQSIPDGLMLTLLNGLITLARYDTLGSIYWICAEKDGWLGLQNAASGRFLRHAGLASGLGCSNSSLGTWERLRVESGKGEGNEGSTLFMEHWGGLKPVGITGGKGEERLDRITEADKPGLAWLFFEVMEGEKA